MDLLDMDMFGMSAPANGNDLAAAATPVGKKILDGASNKGLSVFASFRRSDGTMVMDLTFENQSSTTINNVANKFNKNYLGVLPAGPIKCGVMAPGGSTSYALPLTVDKAEPAADKSPGDLPLLNPLLDVRSRSISS